MVEQTLISVVVPIYKVENFLEECVDSIINQTYKNLEIILVDDGSPDRCPQMCDEFAKQDNRIKVIHKQNGGLSDARNAGLEIATGEWITFVDSDDVVDTKMITILFEQVNDEQTLVSCCGYSVFVDKIPQNNEISNVEYCTFEQFEKKSLYTVTWSKLYKIDLWNNIRFPVGRLHEDEFTTYKLLDKSAKIAYNSTGLYFYRQREGSIITQIGEKNIVDKIDAYLERAKYFYEKENIEQYFSAIKVLCQDFLCNYKMKNMTKQIRKNLKCEIKKMELRKGNKKNKLKIWLSVHTPRLMSVLQQLIWDVKGIK